MLTFNDLTKGVNMNHSFYYADKKEAIEAITNYSGKNDYYIVFGNKQKTRVQIYLSLRAIPNGAAEHGKIYEGKSKRQAIAALTTINE